MISEIFCVGPKKYDTPKFMVLYREGMFVCG